MIHYHGTPITPRSKLLEMQGRHFCVSFADPRDLETCLQIGQSLMMDNGAFTAYTKGKPMDKPGFYAWCEEYLAHPNWAVIPDVIGGSVEEQREYMKNTYGRVCLGSSGDFWQIGTRKWEQRMDQVFEMLTKTRRYLPWIHGMRMLGQSDGRWPLSSADSSNIARNHAISNLEPEVMAQRIDAKNPPLKFKSSLQLDWIGEIK